MTFVRLSSTLAALLLTLAAVAGPVAGQTASPASPAQPPAVEAPDPAAPQERPPEYRFPRPIFRGFQNYTLGKDDVVREIRTVFGDVTIEGRVQGDVMVVMGSLRLTSTAVVERSVLVVGGEVDIDAGARIDQDFVVVAGAVNAPPAFSPGHDHVVIGAPFVGEAVRDLLPWMTHGLLWGRLIVPDLEWVWLVVLMFFLAYLTINTVVDRGVAATADVIGERPVSAFFAGLLVLLLSVPVLAIVAASVIGLAIVPFLIAGMIAAALIGKVAVARSIGRGVTRPELPEGRIAALVAFVIGFGVLTLAYMVPVLGFVTWGLTGVLGLGAATATLRAHMRRERRTPPPPPAPAGGIPAAAPMAPVAAPSAAPSMLVEQPAAPAGTYVPLNAEQPTIPPAPGPAAPPVPPPIPPPPVYTQGLAAYPRAMFLDRLAAFVLDCVLVAITNAMLNRHNDDGFYFFLLIAYHIAFWAWKGTTLGGIIVNLRVIRTDGGDPRPADAVIRALSGIFSIIALGIGYLWMLQDPEKQTWHDKIAGTLVVKVPRELVMR
jgi:uncharacterized RDD family membrane protein YckC